MGLRTWRAPCGGRQVSLPGRGVHAIGEHRAVLAAAGCFVKLNRRPAAAPRSTGAPEGARQRPGAPDTNRRRATAARAEQHEGSSHRPRCVAAVTAPWRIGHAHAPRWRRPQRAAGQPRACATRQLVRSVTRRSRGGSEAFGGTHGQSSDVGLKVKGSGGGAGRVRTRCAGARALHTAAPAYRR